MIRTNTDIKRDGYTLIELLIVVVVIGIIAVISSYSLSQILLRARDSQRKSSISIIATRLERYYDENGEYPTCNDIITKDITNLSQGIFSGVNPDTLTAPLAAKGTNSIKACTGDPATNEFFYIGGSMQWTLKYREESTNQVISVNSRRRTAVASPNAPSTTINSNSGTVIATITPVGCSYGIVQYGIQNRVNEGTWSGFSGWSGTTVSSQPATIGFKYEYRAQARCYIDDSLYSSEALGSVASYVEPINAPIAPTVTATTVSGSTTYSWNAATCPSGTSAQYQYRYTITPSGYDSGLIGTQNLSVVFTTSTDGQTYTLQVMAQCYNSFASSSWSPPGSASYYRPADFLLLMENSYVLNKNSSTVYNAGNSSLVALDKDQYTSYAYILKNDGSIYRSSTGGSGTWNLYLDSGTDTDFEDISVTNSVIYTATESGKVYKYNGSSWAIIGNFGSKAGMDYKYRVTSSGSNVFFLGNGGTYRYSGSGTVWNLYRSSWHNNVTTDIEAYLSDVYAVFHPSGPYAGDLMGNTSCSGTTCVSSLGSVKIYSSSTWYGDTESIGFDGYYQYVVPNSGYVYRSRTTPRGGSCTVGCYWDSMYYNHPEHGVDITLLQSF